MKREVSPVLAIVIIVVVLLVIGGIYWFGTGKRPLGGREEPPGIPSDVQAEFQRRMGGMTPGAGAPAPTAPAPR